MCAEPHCCKFNTFQTILHKSCPVLLSNCAVTVWVCRSCSHCSVPCQQAVGKETHFTHSTTKYRYSKPKRQQHPCKSNIINAAPRTRARRQAQPNTPCVTITSAAAGVAVHSRHSVIHSHPQPPASCVCGKWPQLPQQVCGTHTYIQSNTNPFCCWPIGGSPVCCSRAGCC